MNELELSVLGFPIVRKEGKTLSFRTHKTLALLVYLAVERGLHARTKLTSLFWPDSTVAQGRSILRTTLFYLHQALGDASYLTVTRDALGIAPGAQLAIDIHKLQNSRMLLEKASSLSLLAERTAGSELQLSTGLEGVLALYRGPFLDGLSLGDLPAFDEWVVAQRVFWHHQMDRVFDQLSRILLERGEMIRAREVALRWITHEPN